MTARTIVGRLASGIGQGKHFTRLDWARRQFVDRLGIDPYPGTVNVSLDDPAAVAEWTRLQAEPCIRIDNPNDGPNDCDACCWLVQIEDRIAAAIVLPEVAGYAPATIEMIAAVDVRRTLGIADGDPLRVTTRSH